MNKAVMKISNKKYYQKVVSGITNDDISKDLKNLRNEYFASFPDNEAVV